jgi:tetratricopeptide (TPR) repeat protein
LFVLSIVTLLALNFPALNSPMIYDSRLFILANSDVFQRNNVWDVVSIIPVRPLFMVTLYLNYMITGMDPAYFRLLNILLVAASGVAISLLIFVVYETSISQCLCSSAQKLDVSLFLGFVFVIHPLQTLVTLYIWQREAILGCLFYFLTTAVYLATRSGRYGRPTTGYVLTSVLFLAGMLSKENVATVPLVLLLAEATLFRQDLKQMVGRAMRICALTLPPLLLYYAITSGLAGSESHDLHHVGKRLIGYYQYAGLSLVEVLLTQCRVIFSYLASILLPVPGTIALVKAMTISRSLISPPVTAVACAGMMGLIGLGIALIRRRPVTAFAMLFFVIGLIPESVLIPQYLFCGYRAILPMAGVLMILGEVILGVLALGRAGTAVRAVKIAVGAFSAIALAALVAATNFRAASWNPLSFWNEAYEKLPPSPALVEKKPYLDIISNLSGLLVHNGEHPRAANLCQEALAFYPDTYELHDILGVALLYSGRVQEAIEACRKAAELQPQSAEAFNNMGNALLAANRIPEAIEAYKKAIRLKPTKVQPYVNLGAAYVNSGQYKNAVEVLQKGIGVDPEHSKAQANLGIALVKAGLFSDAIKHLTKAIQLDPRMVLAHLQLGVAWEHAGDTGQAVRSYARAIEHAPTSVTARHHLAGALVKLKEYSQAIQQYQIIVQLDPKNHEAHNDLAYALIMTSQFDKAVDHCRKALSLKPDFAEAEANRKLALRRAAQYKTDNPGMTVQP